MSVDEFYTWLEWFQLKAKKDKSGGGGRKTKRRMRR